VRNDERNQFITFRVAADERERLEKAAEVERLTISEFVRRHALLRALKLAPSVH